jgi:hypothetical protein
MLNEARDAGYRGFLVKDHYFPSALGCTMIEKHLAEGDVKIFSSMALNNAMGLFNLKAVDTARQMGTQMIYFPTVSAKNHIDAHKGNFAGSGKASVEEVPVVYVDEKGVMIPWCWERDTALHGKLTIWSKKHLKSASNAFSSTIRIFILVRLMNKCKNGQRWAPILS